MGKCMKCNSEKIIPKAAIDIYSAIIDINSKANLTALQLAVDGDPNAFIFREREYSKVFARVCADCGFTEFYASEAEKLYQAYQKSIAATSSNLVEM
jgi:predicted nucleic-acid-binding Zn-ribbon protein